MICPCPRILVIAIVLPLLFSCNRAPDKKPEDTLTTFTGRFADPPAEYRAIPFWVWNEKISADGIDFQLEKFKEAGIGGVFVHPRPGLITEYLSDEWHTLFDHAVRKGKELGMQVWIYDENSYPSGFAGGKVPAQMPDSYRHGAGLALDIQPVLKTFPADTTEVILRREGDRFKDVTKEAKQLIGQQGPWYVYRKTYPGKSWWYGGFSYVDLLYPGVTQKFLDITMKGYEARNRGDFGSTLAGVFTDEPNLEAALSDGAVMRWTPDLWEAFQKRWGYDLRTSLPSLTDETGNWRKVRHDYYELLLELFIDRWSKPWFEYCRASGLTWTGHYWEHGWPVPTDGIDELAFYTWHQMPGVDMLGFRLDSAGLGGQFGNDRAIRELLSAANQAGWKRTMSETYGGGGWDMPFSEQKRLADWQFALGVNCVNLCLSFYSLNGVRKFDYPLSFTYHEPWWKEYRWMAGYLGRISMAMASGEQINKTIVLQPNTSAWMYFSRQKGNTRLAEIRDGFKKFVYQLEQRQVEYDLGSENVIRQMSHVAGGRLVVGKRDYDLVVIPAEMDNIDAFTLALLTEYMGSGGRVLTFRETVPLVDGEPSAAVADLVKRYGKLWTVADGADDPAALELLIRPGFTMADHSQNGTLYHQRRVFADGQLLFVANPNKTQPAEATVTIAGKYAARLDALTGRIYRYPARSDKEGIAFDIRLEPAGSALFAITGSRMGEPEEKPVTGLWREAETTGPMQVRRESDNVLVMDYLDLKTPWSENKDIHFMEAAIGLYKEYGLEMGNPWQHKIQYEKRYLGMDSLFEGKPGFTATYRFRLKEDLSPEAMNRIRAVAERPGLWELSINGHAVGPTAGEYWTDREFAVYAVGPYLKPGDNMLTLKAPRMHILAEIMPVYLLGDFLVKPADRGFEITGGSIAAAGSWLQAGLPFYPGKVSYTLNFKPLEERQMSYRVVMPEWNGVVAEVAVNGKSAGIIAFPGDEPDVTALLRPGGNDITVTVSGSLKNSFGPFHDRSDTWIIGPHSWIRAPGHQPPGQSYYLNDYGLKGPFRLIYGIKSK